MSTSIIGEPITRIDGRLKVTGGAKYAADYPIENLAYGVAVPSTIANGKISRIDSANAEKMPGVLAVFHHGNFGKLYRPAGAFEDPVSYTHLDVYKRQEAALASRLKRSSV